MPSLTELVNKEAGMTSRSCRHLRSCSLPSPAPALPSGPRSPPTWVARVQPCPPATRPAMVDLALGSAPPLSTNPFSAEGQLRWEEAKEESVRQDLLCVSGSQLTAKKVHFPCQGDWKEGRDGNPCAGGWATGRKLPRGRPQTRLYKLKKPHCHETYSTIWPLL